MAFVLKKAGTPRVVKNWPVVITSAADGGKVSKDEIEVSFLILPQEKMDEQLDASRIAGGNADSDILREVLQDWNGVVDEDGSAVVFNADTLDAALQQVNIRSALINAYFDASSGRKAARKN